jgi:fucose permease
MPWARVLMAGEPGGRVRYLYTTLDFSTAQLNGILVVSEGLLFAGLMTYKDFMREWSWRKVYMLTTGANAVVSILQILLIYRVNRRLGIPDFVFAVGDEVSP